MTWEMNYIKILNVDNNYDNKIKYKVEIRKDNNKFTVIYEGINNNCFINNLEKNTNYEIRMLSFYNNIISDWTQIYKIKTKNVIESYILNKN